MIFNVVSLDVRRNCIHHVCAFRFSQEAFLSTGVWRKEGSMLLTWDNTSSSRAV